MTWFKVKDDCYIDPFELCAMRASPDNHTLWLIFKHAGDVSYSVVNAAEVIARIKAATNPY